MKFALWLSHCPAETGLGLFVPMRQSLYAAESILSILRCAFNFVVAVWERGVVVRCPHTFGYNLIK